MPSKTFSVRIKTGRRTPVEVSVIHPLNESDFKFINGQTLPVDALAEWLVKEINKQLKAIETMPGNE